MPWIMRLVLIVLFITAILAGWHYYLWARLVRDTSLPPHWRLGATMALIGLAVGMVGVMFVSRKFPDDSLRPLYLLLFGWMGTGFLLLLAVGLTDLTRVTFTVGQKFFGTGAPADPERRVALARILAGSALFLGAGGTSLGVATALGTIPVERLRIALRRLPKELQGMTLVQLSDIHVGPTLRRAFVERIVAQTNDLHPDLVVITGDLVDGTVEQLWDQVAPLANLKTRYGVYFVTGNHEYYSGAQAWVRELPKLGVRVLQNERVSIGNETASFDLAGVNDWSASHTPSGDTHDLPAALRGRDPQREVILLAHQPRTIDQAAEHEVGLQLSGHTHGGQIFPWNFLVRLQQPFVVGLHKVKNTLLYINRGTGFWGPPIRLGAPPEITYIELLRGE